MNLDDWADAHQEQRVIALGEHLPQAGSVSLCASGHETFREWLVTVLEDHRVQIHAEFKRHIDTLHSRLSERRPSLGALSSPCDLREAAEPLSSQATRPWQNSVHEKRISTPTLHSGTGSWHALGSTMSKATLRSETRDTGKTVQERMTAAIEQEAPNPVVRNISQMKSMVSRVLTHAKRAVTKHRDDMSACDSSSSALAEQFLTSKRHASTILDYLVGFLILANCAVLICQMEYYGFLSRIALGDIQDDGSWKDADKWFLVSEHIFNALFLIELIARIFIQRLSFLQQPSLIFDAVLVLISSVQLYVLGFLENRGGEQILVFRILRFTRFVRVLRLVRVLKLFTSLRVLVKTVFSSFWALMWSMVLLVVIIANAGLVMSLLLRDFIMNSHENLSTRRWAFRYYGTATRAIYTLFEVTLAGCWPQYFRPLIERVSVWWVVFVVIYISVVVFAIIRIITALFLKETLQIANEDAEMMVHEKMKHKSEYIRKLECVFKAVDISGTGKVSAEEFECIKTNQVVKTWLQHLEVEVHDTDALFNLLHDGGGELTYDEFMKGLMRLKGQARTMDVVGLMHSMDKVHHDLADMQAQLHRIHDGLQGQHVEINKLREH